MFVQRYLAFNNALLMLAHHLHSAWKCFIWTIPDFYKNVITSLENIQINVPLMFVKLLN